VLSIKGLAVHYGIFQAIHDLDMEIPEGQTVSLLGANGSGKSTILKAVSGLVQPTSGEITFSGKRIDGDKPENIVHMGIGSVMEGRRLFPYMSVLENLMMGAFSRRDKDGVAADLEHMFERFPILKEKANDRAALLSGGQQEMVAVARGLMARPKLLVMDEPCQGLSPIMVKEIAGIIRDIHSDGMTILLVEHNVSIALGVADKVYILQNGTIRYEGNPNDFTEDEFVQKVYLAG
jgi:branched-chain amino acid transport system ATP-binding protein